MSEIENHRSVKKTLLKGVKSFFKYSKKDPREMKVLKPKQTKKLPKNFANLILDYELKIDSGQFDMKTVDKLLSLYSVSFNFPDIFNRLIIIDFHVQINYRKLSSTTLESTTRNICTSLREFKTP